MKQRLGQCIRTWISIVLVLLPLLLAPVIARAAPFAALVMDARSGEILYSENADTRLHPASLTKMMTLYIAFEAIRHGEISLDTKVKISARAANEAPSKLGLKAGQTIALRYLIRAAAVKSANDCATAIGEAIGGSEAGFALRMNRTAKALGMRNSTFKNANGLTREGHMSTAHDMVILGRHLFYDFPEYYNIFSRRTTDAGVATVNNTNTRFLDSYRGADGIKTGYTGPAGFNLVASAERGNVRIIAAVFGGTSTAQRNAKMTELLDLGFAKAPAHSATQKPDTPVYADVEEPQVANAAPEQPEVGEAGGAGKTIRVSGSILTSPRPKPRPGSAVPDPGLLLAMQSDIQTALAQAQPVAKTEPAPATPETLAAAATLIGPMPRPQTSDPAADTPVVAASADQGPLPFQLVSQAPAGSIPALQIPAELPFQLVSAAPANSFPALEPAGLAEGLSARTSTSPTPKRRPEMVMLAAATPDASLPEATPEVVTRLSTSDGRVWGLTLGKYNSPQEAERVLMKTALAESGTLADALRKVVKRKTGYEANFAGMSRDQADLACRRLQARAIQCFTLGP